MQVASKSIRGRLALLLGVTTLALTAGLLACSKKSTSPTNPNPGPPPPSSLSLLLVKSGLNFPIFLTAAPGDTSRLFVLEKGGLIRIIKNGTLLTTPFLDVSSLVSTGDEEGLLSMAFDPSYASNGRFYISYTDVNGDNQLARYLVSTNADVAQASPQKLLLNIVQPNEVNHKGGMIAFGPEGYLYMSVGDGGGQNDPYNNGQSKDDFQGSLLRLDVSGTGDYGIPGDNPYLPNSPPALGELWDIGFRNPWRFSFDRVTHDLYIADVGQDTYEEVDVGLNSAGRGKAANYGWSVTEANSCFNPSTGCNKIGLTAPVLVYDHGQGCAVIGGYVYRGSQISGLQGTYFYGDHCNGWVKSFRLSAGTATSLTDWPGLDTNGNITSFGEDSRGEIYVLTVGGNVFKIVSP